MQHSKQVNEKNSIKIFVSMLILSSIEDQNDNAIAKEKLFETKINSQLGLKMGSSKS